MCHQEGNAGVESSDGPRADVASTDGEAVGPTVDLTAVSLPPEVGQQLGTLLGSSEPFRSVGAWIEATRERLVRERGRVATVADLCTAADGDHRFVAANGDETQAYVCVLDPLAYPFLTNTPGTIRSVTQVREAELTVDVTSAGVESTHEDAVVSLGVADDVEPVDELSVSVVYRQVCGYVHVFADRQEYDEWESDVDAVTTPIPLETGVGIAKSIADSLFE